jgi:hypothetical protein
MAILGATAGYLYSIRRRLRFMGLLMLSYFLAVFILSPLYSVFGISNGFSFLVLIGVLVIRRILLLSAKKYA